MTVKMVHFLSVCKIF